MQRHEVDMIRLHLESAGIVSWLADEGIVGANPLLANAVGGIKVMVDERDAARAARLIQEMRAKADAQGEGGCLSCGAPMGEDDERCAACGWTYLPDAN